MLSDTHDHSLQLNNIIDDNKLTPWIIHKPNFGFFHIFTKIVSRTQLKIRDTMATLPVNAMTLIMIIEVPT